MKTGTQLKHYKRKNKNNELCYNVVNSFYSTASPNVMKKMAIKQLKRHIHWNGRFEYMFICIQ